MEYNIGIFFVSFAEDHIFAREMIHQQNLGGSFQENNAICKKVRFKIPAWWDYLRKYNYTVDASYGMGGSDIQYSYRNFLTNHHKYEKNIFVVTQPNRISIPYKAKKKQKHFDWIHGTNGEVCIKRKKRALAQGDTKGAEISEGLFHYHMQVNYNNASRDYIFADLMIEKILSIRPDTIMINAFDNWGDITPSIPKTTTLFDIHQIENAKMDLHKSKIYPDFNGYKDMRIAHMTPASSKILAADIHKTIKSGNTWLNFDLQPYRSLSINREDWFVKDAQLISWINNTLGIRLEEV